MSSRSDIKKWVELALKRADEEQLEVRSVTLTSFRKYYNDFRNVSLRLISTRKLVAEYHSLLLYERGIDRRSDKEKDWNLLEEHARYLEAVGTLQRSLLRRLIARLDAIELAAKDENCAAHVLAYAKLPSMERDRREILYLREDSGSHATEAHALRQLRVRSEGSKK